MDVAEDDQEESNHDEYEELLWYSYYFNPYSYYFNPYVYNYPTKIK